MNYLKCKDYFIFKFRFYADKRILDKWHRDGGGVPKQHCDRAVASCNFLLALVKKITGKKQEYWFSEYLFEPYDCMIEEIQETHGIYRFLLSDGYYTFFIPIRHTEIIEWIKPKIKFPHKIIKKTSVGFINHNEDCSFHRSLSAQRTKDFKQKILIAESTRKVLFEKCNNW